MENWLGVPVGLPDALEDQIAGRPKRHAIKGWRHVDIGGIRGVLPIDDGSHALEGRPDLLSRTDAVLQPVCDVLA